MAAPGRISKEIWQVHQVAVKLHISVFFFVQIAARWVAVKLHISFFFFKMAAPGRIGKEIWQAHQVAVKLHISVFFFKCLFSPPPAGNPRHNRAIPHGHA